MCKSSSLAFVLLFAFVFRLEKPTWKLVAIIGTMTVGVIMMAFGEVEFKLGGFLLVITAAFLSGLRWSLTQILLLRNPATSNPFASIFYLAPIMFLVLSLIALPVEGLFELGSGLSSLMAEWGAIRGPIILLFPGTIAFLMTASEFALLQRTSVVTLSIAGTFKEVVTISAAAIFYGDRLTRVNFIGLVVTIVAIAAYNWIKIARARETAIEEVHRDHAAAELDGIASSGGVGGTSGVGSGSGSDLDADADADEDAALLQRERSPQRGDMFTADGDLIPKSTGSPPLESHAGEPHHKTQREED